MNNNYGDFHDFDVQLYRDSLSRPWGFRIQGGADFNFPLTVQRVFSGSPSEVKLLRGDVILALDGYDVGRLTHKQAQDVIRVAGASLTIRIRRPGSKSLKTSMASPQIRRPHSATPRQDSTSAYFTFNQPPKPTWQPPSSSQTTSSPLGNFGVQYGPTKTSSLQHRPTVPTVSSRQSPQFISQSPHDEEDMTLKRVEDSLQKLTMNHLTNDEDEVDYSFTKKSVSERRKLFQDDNKSQNDSRYRSTSCTPSIRAINASNQFSMPQMTSSYTEPTRNTCRSTTSIMSSSYTEGTRNHVSTPSWQKPTTGFNFGWSPSPEKLAAARHAPIVSSVSQMQHSVQRSRDSSRENSPEHDPWRSFGGGAPLMRSTSVSVLQETPTRSTIQRFECSTPRVNTQLSGLNKGPFKEIGRWSMSSHLQAEPTTPSWRVYPSSGGSSWSPPHSTAKKYSTSATIRVGQSSSSQQTPVRTVRRFSTSSTPMDGTMSLDRRHHEPLQISIGSSYQADYHPAYPANVYQQVDRSWLKPSRQPLQRSASHKAPSRHTARTEVGTYRPLQQNFNSHSRSQSAIDPDNMSSDF